MTVLEPEVLIIGGGPAGLTAATRLSAQLRGEVLVVEREADAGGIPRHSDHVGYGIRDLRTFTSGPTYARRLVDRARSTGATIKTNTMVTGWTADGDAEITSPSGRFLVRAQAVVLATGARERPRSARLIPGDRPHGVYTTGQLQNLVHLHHRVPGRRAVVVGAELVSWSAVMTLREAGCATVAMLSTHRRPESYTALTLAGRTALRTPVRTRTRVVAIHGRGRVCGVEVEHLDTGERRMIACDTVVFTGDWVPDNELVRLAGLDVDPHTLGPTVDTALRTSRPGVFAAGNLVHPVDTADIAALDGRHVAGQVLAWLNGSRPLDPGVRLLAEAPFRWISPSRIRPTDPAPARSRLLLWSDEFVHFPRVSVTQNGRELSRRRIAWPASPGRVFRLPSALLDDVDFAAGDVTLALR